MYVCRCRWPRGLRQGPAATRYLGFRVRILPGAQMSVPYECCVLSSSGLWDGPIPRPEESYRVWHVWMWYLETSTMRRTRTMSIYTYIYIYIHIYQRLLTSGSRSKFCSLSYSERIATQFKGWINYRCLLSLLYTLFIPLHVPFSTLIFICDSWCRKTRSPA
jgi:hypothetical protein